MDFLRFSLVYLMLFRISIVAAGTVCIVLGYKLFAHNIGAASLAKDKSTVEASLIGTKLSVKNAAPGTVFALFGALLLVVMMVQDAPSVVYEKLSKLKPDQQSGLSTTIDDSEKVTLRGDAQESIALLTAQGVEAEKRGDVTNAQRSYEKALRTMAEPINDLAWIYLNSGRTNEAINLAEIAVKLTPDEPRYRDTEQRAANSQPLSKTR